MDQPNEQHLRERVTRWRSPLAIAAAAYLLFEALSGLAILLLPFSIPTQVAVLVHTAVGALLLVPCLWYLVRHWIDYWQNPASHILVLGYFGLAALLACLVSGAVLTVQAAFGIRISYGWDTIHTATTFATLIFGLLHVVLIAIRAGGAARAYARGSAVAALGGVALIALGAVAYRPLRLQTAFPADYSYKFGPRRPFAPSLASTADGRALDARLISGSESCGTSRCHQQIVEEWQASAHRYAAMDAGFQKIQMTMAQQNGPESTRYCGGCHDPISLFSGTKNLYVDADKLSSLRGYQEGVSCLACHSVRKVDVKGNANYTIGRPASYMFELEYDSSRAAGARFVRDFLIRAYPGQHLKDLSKRLFKAPEYCAACHKQFIDQEINRVGWVQLQNQYDNWRQSRWNHTGDPKRTIECRECHMPLVSSHDPASGDSYDYNRFPGDGKHRSHRFVAANQLMPALLKLPGWSRQVELTNQWLQGRYEIPEIAHKWSSGPAVALEMQTPAAVAPGEKVPVKLIITSNKVGHDFPTGPLDIIQAWVELIVTDAEGRAVFSSGTVDAKGFIQPGSFMFKAEPVDQSGNLIDRHNLWEMVGVRYRRALFPGFSDQTDYSFFCPQLAPVHTKAFPQTAAYELGAPRSGAGKLHVEARLCYRKIDQYLLNFLFGEKSGLTSPVTVMTSQTRTIEIRAARPQAGI